MVSSVMPPESSTVARLSIMRTPFARFFRAEIVKQKFLCAGCQSFVEFGARANFNLHRQQRVFDRGERSVNASRGCDVIVLDQHRVVQSHAMIGDAAG